VSFLKIDIFHGGKEYRGYRMLKIYISRIFWIFLKKAKSLLSALQRYGLVGGANNFAEKTAKLYPENNIITVLCAINRTYEMPFAVMVRSLLDNLESGWKVRLFVISNDITEESKNKILESLDLNKINIEWLRMSDSLFEKLDKLAKYEYFGVEVYWRLLVTDLLPEDIKKVLYLDSDILVTDSISDLWKVNLGNYPAAAVPRYPEFFNCGVLLINLAKWRESDIGWQAIKYIEKKRESITWRVQDALNFVLKYKWIELDKKWNIGAYSVDESIPKGIIHFWCDRKPWQVIYKDCPLKKEFFRYLDKTSWKGLRIKELSYADLLFVKFFELIRGIVKKIEVTRGAVKKIEGSQFADAYFNALKDIEELVNKIKSDKKNSRKSLLDSEKLRNLTSFCLKYEFYLKSQMENSKTGERYNPYVLGVNRLEEEDARCPE